MGKEIYKITKVHQDDGWFPDKEFIMTLVGKVSNLKTEEEWSSFKFYYDPVPDIFDNEHCEGYINLKKAVLEKIS